MLINHHFPYLMIKLGYIKSCLKSVRTKQKLIVIESDDWGSQRIPNVQVQNELIKSGIILSGPYFKFDTLERLEDLENLESILKKIESKYNKKIVLTFNFIMENPDFEKIRQSNFKNYLGESFIKTYYNRDNNDLVWRKIQSLISDGFIHPQYHGREHLNTKHWLYELENSNKSFIIAFNHNCYAVDIKTDHTDNILSSFQYNSLVEQKYVTDSIIDGHAKFTDIFGYVSKSIVIPRHVWHPDLNKIFAQCGVKYIQTSLSQYVISSGDKHKISHHTGEVDSENNLKFIVRNIFFEPSYDPSYNWLAKSIQKIEWMFRLNIPVIISMHRINFVGGLHESNREKNLSLFFELLELIIKKYPEVKFVSSDQLLEL